jgi:hypothetical protein
MNLEITFRPSSHQEKWKMPAIGVVSRGCDKLKRVSQFKILTEVKFARNSDDEAP